MRAWYEGSAQLSNINKVLYNILTGQNPHAGIVAGANDVITVDGTVDNTTPWRRISDSRFVAGMPESHTRTVRTRRGLMSISKRVGNPDLVSRAKGRVRVEGTLDFTNILTLDPKGVYNDFARKAEMQAGDIKSVMVTAYFPNDHRNAQVGDAIHVRVKAYFVDLNGNLQTLDTIGGFADRWSEGYRYIETTLGASFTLAELPGLTFTTLLDEDLGADARLIEDPETAFDLAFVPGMAFYMGFSAVKPESTDWLPWSDARAVDGPDGAPVGPDSITIEGTTYLNGVDFEIVDPLQHPDYLGTSRATLWADPCFVRWLTAGPAAGATYQATFDTQDFVVELRPMGAVHSNKIQLPVLPYLGYSKGHRARSGGVGLFTHGQSTFPYYDSSSVPGYRGSMIVYLDPNQVNDDSPIFYRVMVSESFVAIFLIGDPGTTGQSAIGFFGKYVANAPTVDLYPYIVHLGSSLSHGQYGQRDFRMERAIPLSWKWFDVFHKLGLTPQPSYVWYDTSFEQLPLPNGEATTTKIDKRWQLSNWILRDTDGGGYRGALPSVYRTPGTGWASGDSYVVNEGQAGEERFFLYVPGGQDGWPKVAVRYK